MAGRGGGRVPAGRRGGHVAVPVPRRGGRPHRVPARLRDDDHNQEPEMVEGGIDEAGDVINHDAFNALRQQLEQQFQQQINALQQQFLQLPLPPQPQPQPEVRQERSKLKLKTYDGNFDYRTYRNQFQNVAELNNWTLQEKKAQLLNAAQGKAADVLSDLPDNCTFADIDSMLAKHFDQSQTSWQALHEVDSASRKPDETVREFARRVEHMIRVANPDAGPITLERQAIKAFARGINYPDIKNHILSQVGGTLDDAVQLTLKLTADGSIPSTSSKSTPKKVRMTRPLSESDDDDAGTQPPAKVRAVTSTPVSTAEVVSPAPGAEVVRALQALTQKIDGITGNAQPSTSGATQGQDNTQHYRGRGRGRGRARGRGRGRGNSNGNGPICFFCHQPGHILNNCPTRIQANNNNVGYLPQAQGVPPTLPPQFYHMALSWMLNNNGQRALTGSNNNSGNSPNNSNGSGNL